VGGTLGEFLCPTVYTGAVVVFLASSRGGVSCASVAAHCALDQTRKQVIMVGLAVAVALVLFERDFRSLL
jgi:hypothetical protein